MHVDEKELAEVENAAKRFAMFTFERIDRKVPGSAGTFGHGSA